MCSSNVFLQCIIAAMLLEQQKNTKTNATTQRNNFHISEYTHVGRHPCSIAQHYTPYFLHNIEITLDNIIILHLNITYI